MRLYYFTSAQFAISNMALQRIKVSRIDEVNDPYELIGVNRRDPNIDYSFVRMRELVAENNGLICFTKHWSNPLLWGHYGDKHKGIALGFDVKSEHLGKVDYLSNPMEISFNTSENKPELNERDMKKLIFSKYEGWQYEEEYRVYAKLNHDALEGGMYFHEFDEQISLREVIIGPLCPIRPETIQKLLGSYQGEVKIIQSELSKEQYKVIAKVD